MSDTDSKSRKRYPQAMARVSAEVMARLERVKAAMQRAVNAAQVEGLAEVMVTDATRAAILAGLDVLEARYGLGAAPAEETKPAPKTAKKTAKRPKGGG